MKFFTILLRWLLGFAAFCHALFGVAAMFWPDQLAVMIGEGRIAFSYVWVGQAGMLMFLIALMSIPALYHPQKFRMFVWIIAAGTLLEGIFWYRVSNPPALTTLPMASTGVVFAPFATFWLIIGIAEVIILLFLTEREIRFGWRNLIDTLDSWCEVRDETNMFMRWFGYLALAQFVFSLFRIYAHLFNQRLLRWPIGEGVLFHSDMWIALSGIELIVLTVMLIPISWAPTRYWAYCWLTMVNLVLSTIWWLLVAREPLHRGFLFYALANAFFAVAMFVVFQIGALEDKKLSSNNYQRFLSFVADTVALRKQPVIVRVIALMVLVLSLTFTWTLWYYFIRTRPDLQYGSDELQYKYGAVGLSIMTRVPWYLFEVMPEVFPELIPAQGGAAGPDNPPLTRFLRAVGAITIPEDHQPTPVGFSLRQVGFQSVEPNCALCHVMQIQIPDSTGPPGALKSVIVYGAPNSQLDIEAYQWFLYEASVSPKFDVPTIMRRIKAKHNLGFLDEFFYSTVIIPSSRRLMQELRSDYLWQRACNRSPQGRGRTDTFNTTKQGIMLMPDDGTTGATDLPQVWQLGRRHKKKMYLHWDGNNGSLPERNFTAAMAVGATPQSAIPSAFDRLVDYFWRLPSAPYPPSLPIDPTKVIEGRKLFVTYCADCHSWAGKNIGQVTQSVGTDPNRAISFTTRHCQDFKKITYPPFYFPNYRKFAEPKYVNVPLDGLWVRAPYLHHGAVPTLWDLLQPATKRPVTFYRGSQIFDPVKVGFASQFDEAEATKLWLTQLDGTQHDVTFKTIGTLYDATLKTIGTLYDTRLKGNSNKGHEYGTGLTDVQKMQLIEYLKTEDFLISGRDIPIPKVDTAPIGPEQPCEEDGLKEIVNCNFN